MRRGGARGAKPMPIPRRRVVVGAAWGTVQVPDRIGVGLSLPLANGRGRRCPGRAPRAGRGGSRGHALAVSTLCRPWRKLQSCGRRVLRQSRVQGRAGRRLGAAAPDKEGMRLRPAAWQPQVSWQGAALPGAFPLPRPAGPGLPAARGSRVLSVFSVLRSKLPTSTFSRPPSQPVAAFSSAPADPHLTSVLAVHSSALSLAL